MKLINWQIESLQKDLQQLKERRKESFESIKEHWSSTYHNSLKDKCEMIYMLAQGLKYNPYSFREVLEVQQVLFLLRMAYLMQHKANIKRCGCGQ